jgi:glycosyltransferase involved in cell wall biosynthesis
VNFRIAWFSPLPPVRSGIAAYSAELLPYLERHVTIECFTDAPTSPEALGSAVAAFDAHTFLWKHRRDPYNLVVYQLGNAPYHDYMWAYIASYPGLVVLHDSRLHHARARRLLSEKRFDDYRTEFWYDHPDAPRDVVEYAVEGLSGPIYYFWSMLRVVMRTARVIAVHSERVAEQLRGEYPDAAIETVRMGVPAMEAGEAERADVRRALALPDRAIVFAVFGKVTAEKRLAAILRALGTLVAEGRHVYLLLVGDAAEYPSLEADVTHHRLVDHVRVTGHVPDTAVASHLAAADVCLCLRWPTARETSASWLRCLAAARPTVLSDLAHLTDVPPDVAMRVDLLDEDRALVEVMRALADDRARRGELARAGHDWWMAHHTMETMAADYRRLIHLAVARPLRMVDDLPAHFRDEYAEPTRTIARRFAVSLDILDPRPPPKDNP